MAITWESIREGDGLPELRKKPGVTQLVKYAAGSGDFNPLHHDYDFPQSKLLGTIIVHGRFKYAALGELVSNWLGHRGRIKKLSCQYKGMDFPNKELVCTGRVVRKYEQDGERLLELELVVANEEGQPTTPGMAIVAFR
jgi:acyl dehydratase